MNYLLRVKIYDWIWTEILNHVPEGGLCGDHDAMAQEILDSLEGFLKENDFALVDMQHGETLPIRLEAGETIENLNITRF